MTKERIWRLDADGDPTPLDEAEYDDEAELQKLIAEHPDVLAGERMTPENPRRWLLISREMGIPDRTDTGDRWAVDHLLLDQDARPTLVEVKRGDNSEIRRKVVGQMLDYAAHATRYWTADTVRERLEAMTGGEDAARERIARLLESDNDSPGWYEEFWEDVDRSLDSENIRLLFVADDIPDDLATVVGFLNRHMAPRVEVLAVELKQFRGEGLRTLVPRVVAGAASATRASRPQTAHTRETLLVEFPEGPIRDAARTLLDRAEAAGAVFEFGTSGVSIRVRCPAWHTQDQRVTVAWIYPPRVPGWGRTHDFSFGGGIFDGYDPPASAELITALESYIEPFTSDPWADPGASSSGVKAWWVAPDDAAVHIETLASRVEDVLHRLATLSSANG